MTANVEDQDSERVAWIKACRAKEEEIGTLPVMEGLVQPPVNDNDSRRIAIVKLGKLIESQ